MPKSGLNKFFFNIVFPSILAIALFIVTIFIFILPSFEKSIMNEKKRMISELANTAWSLMMEYEQEHEAQKLSLKEAQQLAASRIGQIRYGSELKDYFWIIDHQPSMIMHPYRPELIGTDLSSYKDPKGKKLFVEAVKMVEHKGDGYIDYMWQWKDDSTKIVPKLSYVREFEPWGWIIGTGIYLEDVKEEINRLKARLLWISFLITSIITIILAFVIRESLRIENKRNETENKLLISKQKYKSLVEASTEGTLMMVGKRMVFSNLKFSHLSGYDISRVAILSFDDIFTITWETVKAALTDPQKTLSFDTEIKCLDKTKKDVVLYVSHVEHAGNNGYILIIKEVTKQIIKDRQTEHLALELQSTLLLMNQPIKPFAKEIVKCSAAISIHEAALLMKRKNRNALLLYQDNNIIGIINDGDIAKRAVAQKIDVDKPIRDIMTAPVISMSENALLYQAILLLNNQNLSHLTIKNEAGEISGIISLQDIVELQTNQVSLLLHEIEQAEDIESIIKAQKKAQVLVGALIESGDKTQNITHVVTSIADAVTTRAIQLTIETLGAPPCSFAVMVMGSEGRMEQTLSTDQDNAIVYVDQKDEQIAKKTQQYFHQLGKILSTSLNRAGYNYCKGDIMASNPKWTQPLSAWKNYFTSWVNTNDPQSVLDASIFFDFRFVYGDDGLIKELREYVNQICDHKPVFFYHLAQSVTKYKPPVSLFGNIVGKESGKQSHLDIKKILMPITGFIRLYSLKGKINQTNSLERLKQLNQTQTIKKPIYDELAMAFNLLMHIRFRIQSQQIANNNMPTNLVDIESLTQIEVAAIKKIFALITDLITMVNFDFKGGV